MKAAALKIAAHQPQGMPAKAGHEQSLTYKIISTYVMFFLFWEGGKLDEPENCVQKIKNIYAKPIRVPLEIQKSQ
jgi:hypothetical protein